MDREGFLVPDPVQTRLQVDIESIRKDVENINSIHTRLDTAIDRLTDVSTQIKSMLAVHEEKIGRQEKIDDIIFGKIEDRKDEIRKLEDQITKDMNILEKRLINEIKALRNDIGSRVGVLEKYRWIIMGIAIAIGWVVSRNFHEIVEMMAK